MALSTSPVLIGQLTDTHVIAPLGETNESYVDNNARLDAAVESINAESPGLDVVLVTGDLTDTAHPEAFVALAASLERIEVRVLPLPGNHDRRSLVRDTFPDAGWVDGEHASWVHDIDGVRIIGLDSTRPGYAGGEFDDERVAFLDAALAARHDGPTLLAMHHPPFLTGIDWMDGAGFVGLDRFTEVLAAHPGVVDRIVCGHLHRPAVSSVAGVAAQVGMSTVQHVALQLDDDGGPALIHDPVGYQIHRVTPGSIVTHARYIDTGAQPFVPAWAPNYDPAAPSDY
ncbi:MAG: phosphodiesterase [Ilumatobacter sp.]